MVATISSDIVRSTSLHTGDLITLRNKLRSFFRELEGDFPGFWGRIVRGDSIECFIPDYRYALRLAILIKLYVKMNTGALDCSELLKKYGIRFSIGIGGIDYSSQEDDIINGPAIYISGRNLDELGRNSDRYAAIEVEGIPRPICMVLDSYVSLLDSMVNSYSWKQSEVVFYKLRGFKEVEISRLLGILQPSVNTRSTNAQWNLLNTAIRDFEQLDFERICG